MVDDNSIDDAGVEVRLLLRICADDDVKTNSCFKLASKSSRFSDGIDLAAVVVLVLLSWIGCAVELADGASVTKSLPVNFLINSSMDNGGGRVADFDWSLGSSKAGKFKSGTTKSAVTGTMVDVADTSNSSLLSGSRNSFLLASTAVSGF